MTALLNDRYATRVFHFAKVGGGAGEGCGQEESGGIASKLEYVCSATGASQKFGIHRAARITYLVSFPLERDSHSSVFIYIKRR